MAEFTTTTDEILVGLDIGTSKTMVVLSDGEIVRNELGGISTASLVAFHSSERLIGEAGVQQASANPQTAVSKLNRLVGMTEETYQGDVISQVARFPVSFGEGGRLVLGPLACHGGAEQTFSPEAVLAMLLVKLGRQLAAKAPAAPAAAPRVALAVPPGLAPAQRRALRDALAVAGLGATGAAASLWPAPAALAAALAPKYPAPAEGGAVAAVVDLGEAQASVSLVHFHQGESKVLATAADYHLGCLNFDLLIFRHLSAKHGLADAGVALGNKSGSRLLAACEKLRKLLSTLPTAQLAVEMLVEDRDFSFSLTREELAECCAEPLRRFAGLARRALGEWGPGGGGGGEEEQRGGPGGVASVELVGGGARMPAVQEILQEVFPGAPLGQKLDDGSAAYGAALLAKKKLAAAARAAAAAAQAAKQAGEEGAGEEGGEAAPADDAAPAEEAAGEDAAAQEEVGAQEEEQEEEEEERAFDEEEGLGLSAEAIAAAVAAEAEMQAKDNESREIAHFKNAIEAFVLEIRNNYSGKHGELLNRETMDPLLTEWEDWLWSEEAAAATLEAARAKHEEAQRKAREVGAAYFEAVEADRRATEAALEAEAAQAAADRAAHGGDEDDDHDFRKLKKADRMRMVVKNKEEGNELFKGGNFRPAAARYVKAITHCTKFFDLGPEDEAEVRDLKVALYMNVAKCYLKMDNLDKMLQNCNDALSYNGDNPKALYLRAFCYEKKRKFEESKVDLEKALKFNAEDSASIKLLERVKIQIKRQEAKEKKMWSKAFT